MSVSLARAPFLFTVGAALALSACATTGPSPTHVTRFNLGQPIAPGVISVEPRPGSIDPQSLEFANYASPIGAELARLGFRLAPGVAASELVAVVDVQRMSREGPPRSSGVSIGLGIGGASFGRHSAVGGGTGVSFPVGRPRPNEIVGTQLSVQIKRRSDGSVIWEGRAMGEARGGTPGAEPDATAARLAHALFVDFPGQSGRTIEVK